MRTHRARESRGAIVRRQMFKNKDDECIKVVLKAA